MRFQLKPAVRYLSEHKLRTFLTTLVIVIGVMVRFGMGILLPSMNDALNKSLLAASGQVDLMITHNTGETFSATTLNKIKDTKGIAVTGGSTSSRRISRLTTRPPASSLSTRSRPSWAVPTR